MRPGLLRHRKFARLARLVGSKAAALGHLEFMWAVAYENGDEVLGDAGDLEHLTEWTGKPGELAAALVESGFVDLDGGLYRVHDLWDHAPDYVQRRAEREAERQKKGKSLSDLRREAANKRWSRAKQTDASGLQVTGACNANGATRAPAPAPAPAQEAALGARPTNGVSTFVASQAAACPELFAVLEQAVAQGVGVRLSRKVAENGEANGLVKVLGAAAALEAMVAAAGRRKDGCDDVPIAYVLPALREATKRNGARAPPTSARGAQPVGQDFTKTLADIGGT